MMDGQMDKQIDGNELTCRQIQVWPPISQTLSILVTKVIREVAKPNTYHTSRGRFSFFVNNINKRRSSNIKCSLRVCYANNSVGSPETRRHEDCLYKWSSRRVKTHRKGYIIIQGRCANWQVGEREQGEIRKRQEQKHNKSPLWKKQHLSYGRKEMVLQSNAQRQRWWPVGNDEISLEWKRSCKKDVWKLCMIKEWKQSWEGNKCYFVLLSTLLFCYDYEYFR